MLGIGQSIFIVIASVALALVLLVTFKRFWPSSARRLYNDVIGWHVGVIGTTYAVILAFMLSGVWTNFENAANNAELEANSLVSIFRLSNGLPLPIRESIQGLCRKYADVMVKEEWSAMSRGMLSPESSHITKRLWNTVTSARLQSVSEQTIMNRLLAELTNLTEYRRIRQSQSRSKLPGLLWAVLLIGGTITVSYSCLFGTDNFFFHALHVVALSLMISLVLVTIADIDQPFRGGVHVSSSGFDSASKTFTADLSRAE